MTLADCTRPELIVPSLRGEDAASVIHELSLALYRGGELPDLLPFYHSAFNRELTVSSVLDSGIAFPHARVAGLAGPVFALGRSSRPLAWDPSLAPAVRLVFLVAIPEGESTRYLNVVAALTRLPEAGTLMENLLTSGNSHDMLRSLATVPVGDITSPRHTLGI